MYSNRGVDNSRQHVIRAELVPTLWAKYAKYYIFCVSSMLKKHLLCHGYRVNHTTSSNNDKLLKKENEEYPKTATNCNKLIKSIT